MESVPERRIIHLDMDAFYASIEIRDQPELAGKPVGVGGARSRRGVLTTCNYEARKYGIRSAMPTFMALQKCPQLILLPTRFDVYRRESAIIRQILLSHTPLVEPLSLDEAYLDVTAKSGDPSALAYVLRRQIYQKTRLPSSAGIAPNKMLAKIASDWRKPNGQFTLKQEDVTAFMKALPAARLPGIGPVTAGRLQKLGITTCADLQILSSFEMAQHFGKFGLELYRLCRGLDERKVEPDRERKSLSNENTFAQDLHTLEECQTALTPLQQELKDELAAKIGLPECAGIFVKLKFSDFTRTSVDRAGLLPELNNYRTLLTEGFARTGKAVRLIGVGVRFVEKENALKPQQAEFTFA